MIYKENIERIIKHVRESHKIAEDYYKRDYIKGNSASEESAYAVRILNVLKEECGSNQPSLFGVE